MRHKDTELMRRIRSFFLCKSSLWACSFVLRELGDTCYFKY